MRSNLYVYTVCYYDAVGNEEVTKYGVVVGKSIPDATDNVLHDFQDELNEVYSIKIEVIEGTEWGDIDWVDLRGYMERKGV